LLQLAEFLMQFDKFFTDSSTLSELLGLYQTHNLYINFTVEQDLQDDKILFSSREVMIKASVLITYTSRRISSDQSRITVVCFVGPHEQLFIAIVRS